MKRLYLVEPVIAAYSFANSLIYPLVQQYAYRRLWQELTNTTYPAIDISGCAKNHSRKHEEVERAASLFSLYNELCALIPNLFITVLLVAYTDQRGRRIAILSPLVGSIVYTISFLAISFFELSLNLLMVCSFVSALFGSWESLMGGSFSYIADMCQDGQQKTQRMAGMELVMGVFSSAASVSSGYFLRAAGFNWPFFTSSLLHFSNLLYVVFVLEETVKLPESRDVQEGGLCAPLLKIANGVRQVFVSASRRKNTMLVLLHLAFMVVTVCNTGTASVLILYELNEPLCWSEILIGYGSALSTTSCVISFAGVFILSRCLPDLVIVLIGLLSIVTWLTMAAFTKTTQLMLLVRVPMVLCIMPAPVIRSMMSKITTKSDQGALFACVAFVETLSSSMGSIAFSSLYAATVSWFPGFCFLLAAGLCLSSMALMGAVGTLGSNAATETEGLVSREEMDS